MIVESDREVNTDLAVARSSDGKQEGKRREGNRRGGRGMAILSIKDP